MILNLDSKHNLNTSAKMVGVDAENYVEELKIYIEEERLWSYRPYLEFQSGDARYSTEELTINQEDGSITYRLPNGLMKEGVLNIQVVLRKQIDDKQYVWKSQIKTLVVARSVNADEELQDEYPDFISTAQELIDRLDEYSYEWDKLRTIEEGAQVNLIEKISKNGTLLPIQEGKIVDIDLSEYALGNEAGANFTAEIDNQTYIMTFTLLDRDNNILKQQTIDLPIESLVVSGRYDNTIKAIILTLQSGQTITIPVGDLIGGLQAEITPSNMLGSDLVDDNNNLHKFVSQNQKDKLDGIEAQAQVNILEGIKVNGVDLAIDNEKKSNIDLTGYVLHTDIGAVPVSDIRALFHNGESGGGE